MKWKKRLRRLEAKVERLVLHAAGNRIEIDYLRREVSALRELVRDG